MEGRWIKWLASSFVGVSLGCAQTKPQVTYDTEAASPKHIVKSEEASVKDDAPIRPETILAVADLRAAAARDPNKSTLEREGLQSEARRFYTTVLSKHPNHTRALRGLAQLYHDMGEKERAVEIYQKAVQSNPQDAELWFGLGICQGHIKDWNGASESFTEATRIDPENRMFRRWLGRTLALAGRTEEGVAWLTRVMPEAEARYEIAQLMFHSSQPELSRQQLALSMRSDPSFQLAREALEAMNDGSSIQTVGFESSDVMTLPVQAPAPLPEPIHIGQPQALPQSVVRPAATLGNIPEPISENQPQANTKRVIPPPVITSGWER